jgi:hypothetical protein
VAFYGLPSGVVNKVSKTCKSAPLLVGPSHVNNTVSINRGFT